MRIPLCFGALLGLLLLSGCSDYVGDFQYAPHPAIEEIPPNPPDKYPPVSAFASVIGVRRADSRDPEAVEVRFRLENNGPHSVSFDPQSMQLMTGDLEAFDPPIVHPQDPITLAAGDVAIVDALFPFPPRQSSGNTDMRSLQLRWRERIDGSAVGQSTQFRRIYPYRYYYGPDPYWGPPVFIGGAVVVHRWR